MRDHDQFCGTRIMIRISGGNLHEIQITEIIKKNILLNSTIIKNASVIIYQPNTRQNCEVQQVPYKKEIHRIKN